MMRTRREELIDVLRRRLVPALEHAGFAIVNVSAAEGRSQVAAAFPCGRLRRRTDDGYDLVEIQFEKDGSAAFRLNVGRVPHAGIEHAVGHVAAKDVWVHYLEHFCTLYSGCFFRRWFRARADATQAEMDELANLVIRLLPQIDDYFRHGNQGRNLRCV